MQTVWDVAVVGGSFAGLACAQAAAERGLRTVVLDRKPEPGAAIHTTGLLVKEAAESLDVPERLTRRISRVRLYAPSLRHIDLHSPGYHFLATDTPGLMRWLAARAQSSGAHLAYGSPYRGAQLDPARSPHFCLTDREMKARVLVGADGPRSTVAREFGLGLNTRFLAGAEVEFENVHAADPEWEQCLHCFLDSKLAPGYIGWVVPGVGGVVQAGLACSQPHQPKLDAFLEHIKPCFDFQQARRIGARGGLIPIGGPVSRFSAPGVFLIGDAAGLVSPLTAGGIHTALASGRRAGEALAEYLLTGRTDPARTLLATCPRYYFKRVLRSALDLRPPNWLLNASLSNPLLRALAQTVFFHHRGLFTLAAWRELSRLPITG